MVLLKKGIRLLFFIALSFHAVDGIAQFSSPVQIVGRGATIEPRNLIDYPTAGILPKGSFASNIEFFQEGGLLASLSFGILDRLDVGISYGGSKIVGSEDASFNKVPGLNLKLRILDESVEFVALTIGFGSQGKESYIDSTNRYMIKSPGFFAVASKNYSFLGHLSIHGGLNYSLERGDEDRDLNAFLGVEKTLGSAMSLVGEYILATNDDGAKALGRGRGYLNFGWRWSIADGLALGLDLKDLTKNQIQESFANRTLKLEYIRFF